MVGWEMMRERMAGEGRAADIASCMTGRSSPALVPKAVNPRMRSFSEMRTLMKPRVSERGRARRLGCGGILGETISNSLRFRLILGQADVGQLRVDEGAGGTLAAGGGAIGSCEVVADGAEVVEGDVGEVRGAGAVAHSPDAG